MTKTINVSYIVAVRVTVKQLGLEYPVF